MVRSTIRRSLVASKGTTGLASFPFAASTIQTHQLHAASFHTVSEPVGIRRLVAQKSFDPATTPSNIEQSFDGIYFRDLSGRGKHRHGNSLAVDHHHNLTTLTLLRLGDAGAPFSQAKRLHRPSLVTSAATLAAPSNAAAVTILFRWLRLLPTACGVANTL